MTEPQMKELQRIKQEALHEYKTAIVELARHYYRLSALPRGMPVIELPMWFVNEGNSWQSRPAVILYGDDAIRAFNEADSAGDYLIGALVRLGEVPAQLERAKLTAKLAAIKDGEIYRALSISIGN